MPPPTTATVPPEPDRNLGRWRAAYLPHGWIGASRNADEVAGRVAELRRAGFSHQIHNLGALGPTGRVADGDYAGLAAWVQHSRSAAPEQRIVAWVSGSESAHVDNEVVHDDLASFLADLVGRYGLDGVLLDLEPFAADNPRYLHLLDRVRSALPDTWLGVTGPADGQWSPAYIAQIAARVDGLSPMLYDSSLGTAAAFEEWATRSLDRYADAIGTSAQLFPSIPSYSANRYHDPAVENVETASRAIRASHGLDGAAVYWWWEFGDADRASWAALRDQF